ncbi:MAG: FAD-dependent oxidoreductase, partial [Burkholderiaceae bacterium]|nr:FAD-dependent oxidoreductase [Burkholderiaceae bacterium]
MIRISEIRLPLAQADAPDDALRAAAAHALDVPPQDIASLGVFKRSFDARKADLLAVYTVDVTLARPHLEAALLEQHASNL